MIVLFPEPLGPTTAMVVPAFTVKLKFSKTRLGLEGYAKQTSQNSIFPETSRKTVPSSNLLEFETDAIIFMILAAATRPLAIEPRFGAA